LDFVGRQYFTFQHALILSADKSKILRCDWLANVNNNNNEMESEWVHDDIVELIQLYETSELLEGLRLTQWFS